MDTLALSSSLLFPDWSLERTGEYKKEPWSQGALEDGLSPWGGGLGESPTSFLDPLLDIPNTPLCHSSHSFCLVPSGFRLRLLPEGEDGGHCCISQAQGEYGLQLRQSLRFCGLVSLPPLAKDSVRLFPDSLRSSPLMEHLPRVPRSLLAVTSCSSTGIFPA